MISQEKKKKKSHLVLEPRAAVLSYASSLELGCVRTVILNCTKSEFHTDNSSSLTVCKDVLSAMEIHAGLALSVNISRW